MASLRISILESFLSGGRVGSSFRSSAKATLKASTRMRSLVACAERYLAVARRLLRFSSRLSGGSALHLTPRSSPSAGSSETQPAAAFSPLSMLSGSAWVQERSASAWSGLSIIFKLLTFTFSLPQEPVGNNNQSPSLQEAVQESDKNLTAGRRPPPKIQNPRLRNNIKSYE